MYSLPSFSNNQLLANLDSWPSLSTFPTLIVLLQISNIVSFHPHASAKDEDSFQKEKAMPFHT